MSEIAFPYAVDGRGRTASAGAEAHARDLVEQVLFTAPGERVNRPDFGSGVLALLFEPLDEARAAAAQHTVQAALQRWLGDVILLEGVEVEADDSALRITVSYTVRASGERRVDDFTSGGVP